MVDLFGERIKHQRDKLSLSLIDFSREIGVDPISQEKYEEGVLVPDIYYLYKLHRLGVDIDYVITGIPSKIDLTGV